MAFINTQFPDRLAQGAVARAETSNEVVETDGGYEQINERWAYPRHLYEIELPATRTDDTDYLAVRSLYYQARTAHTFLFRDFGDDTLTLEQIGTGDGTTTAFQIQKYYSSASYGRKITRLSAVTAATVAGVSAAYTVDLATGIITFSVAPANGAAIRVSGTFLVPVRFAEPIDFEGIDYRTQQARSIVLREVKE